MMIPDCCLRVNTAMRTLFYSRRNYEYAGETLRLTRDYILKFVGNTEESEGMILSEENIPKRRNLDFDSIINEYGNLTSFECACNELYFPINQTELLSCAVIEIGKSLFAAIRSKFFGQKFHIHLSCDCGVYPSITAWFHLSREGEFYFDECIDNYSQPVLDFVFST